MREKINLLFYSDIISPNHKFPTYYAENIGENLWKIETAPIVCRGKLSNIISNLCFDFDELDEDDQKKYETKKITFTNTHQFTENNIPIYKQETKIYKKSIRHKS